MEVWVGVSAQGMLAVAGRGLIGVGVTPVGSGEDGERADARERVVEVLLPWPAGGHP